MLEKKEYIHNIDNIDDIGSGVVKNVSEAEVELGQAHQLEFQIVWAYCWNMIKTNIHLTGAATNPWIRFEYNDSFIKFEIGTN